MFMNKIRLTIYMEMGYNKDGDYLVSCVSDELINIEKKIIAHEEDIYVEIIDIEDCKITIKAESDIYILNKEESIKFNYWTGDYVGDGTSFQYIFVISWKEFDIINYEKTKIELNKDFLLKDLK